VALAKQGFLPKNQVNASLRAVSSAETAYAAHRTNYAKEVESQLAEIQKRREALEKQLKLASAETERTLIRAPVSGAVVGMKVNTVGGVIGGGAVLMELVPDQSGLILEVKVPPTAIDKVFVGLEADIRFTAFSSATTPVVIGQVLTVGADRIPLPNAMPGDSVTEYFLATVRPTPEGLEKLGELAIQPGMPADVIIKTGERSFMSYFAKPLTDRLAKAFKDS
jgi:protease secretion system membrane fusion protein